MAGLPVHFLSACEKGAKPDLGLAAFFYLPRPSGLTTAARFPGLIVGHGAGSRAARHERFCATACAAGFAVLALDFRGHGGSGGRGDGPLEEDILAAVRYLRAHPSVDPGLICYRGSSMGGFYGLKAAPEAGFTAVVLICPASETTMLDAIHEQSEAPFADGDVPDAPLAGGVSTPFARGASPARSTEPAQPRAGAAGRPVDPGVLRSTKQRPADEEATHWDAPRLRAYFERQDSLVLAARVPCPVLLLHARGDDVVPLEHSLLLARHLRGDTTLRVFPGGSHTSAQHDPTVHAYSLGWLQDRVEAARAGGT